MIKKKIIKASLYMILVGIQLFTSYGCKSTGPAVSESTPLKSTGQISAVGTLLPQGTTSYQYGLFILVDENGKTVYALKSDVVQLLNYTGKKVSLTGMLIEGYPIEGGPPYMDVVKLEEFGSN